MEHGFRPSDDQTNVEGILRDAVLLHHQQTSTFTPSVTATSLRQQQQVDLINLSDLHNLTSIECSVSYSSSQIQVNSMQARMARGIYGVPKVSPGPALPNSSTPCGQTTPETVLWPFRGWPAQRVGGLRSSSSPLDTPHHTGLNSMIRRTVLKDNIYLFIVKY
jgi:hypothetical protein